MKEGSHADVEMARNAGLPQPDRLTHTAQLAVVTHGACQYEYTDPRIAVIRGHRGQVAQQQPEPGRWSSKLPALLEYVGNLRSN